MGSKIKKIEYYLPKNVLTNSALEKEYKNWDAEKIERKVGIRERRIAGENETALDMAFKSAQKILADYDKSKIDFLLLCTQSPDYYLPTSACILQEMLGLGTSVGAFDFNLGCSGYVYGLAIANGLICSNIAENILLITSETYSKYIHPLDCGNRTIFGDGATSTIIEKNDQNGIFEFVLGTDGRGYKNLIVPNGGLRNRFKKQDTMDNNTPNDDNLYMNGPEIFNFTIEAVPNLVEKALSKNKTTMADVNFVIFHQANKYMLEYLRDKINIPKEKFYINLVQTGNTVSSTIPIALKQCLDNKMIKIGDKILLVGFGVGYSYGATIIQI